MQAKDQVSCELLRSIAAPGQFITIIHAPSKEAVQAVVDKLEQDALYSRLVSLVEGQVTCSDYTRAWQFQ
jgi:hypothetical protein